MAFVFGLQVKGTKTEEFDVDIAVYFTLEAKSLEWEEEKEYPAEDQIWTDVEKILGARTDLVALNRAPSTLACAVLREGWPIIIKDRAFFTFVFGGQRRG